MRKSVVKVFRSLLGTMLLVPGFAAAEPVQVSSVSAIRDAMLAATAGTVIEIAAGDYAFDSAVWTGADGAAAAPIVVRAAKTGDVRFDFSNTQEGVVVAHAHWTLEHLWVNGACSGGCGGGASGVHVKAAANRVVVRQSRITNWGQNIKSDRDGAAEPTDGLLIGNEIYNDAPEITSGGTAIDLVGGLRWRIVGNYVHDYARDETHYGIFVKGGARDAVIERNLVIGAKTLPRGAGAAVGISFGGGGTGSQYCAPDNVGDGGCACETFDGIARNNIVLETTDAGLHTKRACGSVFSHNTVYDTLLGLQVERVGPSAPVVLQGGVLSRDVSGTAQASDNLLNVSTETFAMLYADPEAVDFSAGSDPSPILGMVSVSAAAPEDYFGRSRPALATLGAVELPTDGSVFPWSEAAAEAAGPGDADGGTTSSSGGSAAPGAGAPDGGASSGAPTSPGAAPSTPEDEGCSCGVAGAERSDGGFWFAGFALAAWSLQQRRRRARATR